MTDDRTTLDLQAIRATEYDRSVNAEFQERAPFTSWLLQSELRYEVSATASDLSHVGSGNPLFKTSVLPLPFTHSNVVVDGEVGIIASTRRVAELVEKTVLDALTAGVSTCGFQGYPEDIRGQALSMRKLLSDRKCYGPYAVLCDMRSAHSYADQYMRVEGISAVVNLQNPVNTPKRIMFQATVDVFRLIVGALPQVVRWGADGKLKVLCILVPQRRTDYHGNVGVLKVGEDG